MKRIIRVFPRETKATPDDEMVRIGFPTLFEDAADEIRISASFTWDLPLVEELVECWKPYGPVTVGGPAIGTRGEEFTPGLYVKRGYTITSRGCPNKCWFCKVWSRDGGIRELKIEDGFNVLDDNLLACSDDHIRRVFAMLGRQKEKPQFTGGLEAARLKTWHAEAIVALKTKQVFFAYDTEAKLDHLRCAAETMIKAGFKINGHGMRCFVLCGFPKDTFAAAEARMRKIMEFGFVPMAMVYRAEDGSKPEGWAAFQKFWARPAFIYGAKGKGPKWLK